MSEDIEVKLTFTQWHIDKINKVIDSMLQSAYSETEVIPPKVRVSVREELLKYLMKNE